MIHSERLLHIVLFGVLIFVAFFVSFSLTQAPSQAATGEVDVENVAPTVIGDPIVALGALGSEIYPDGIIDNLNAGATNRTIWVRGGVEDQNGFDDFYSVRVKLYRNDSACSSFDGNHCYANTTFGTCTLVPTGGSTIRGDYLCALPLRSWMDATDADAGADSDKHFILSVLVDDVDAASTTNTNRTFEVSSFVSVDIPSTIDFGTMSFNTSTTSATNVSQTLTNQGNVVQDITVSMTDSTMACSQSSTGIDRGNLRWSLTDVDYADSAEMTASTVDTEVNIAKRVSETVATTDSLFWNLFVPYGVEGTCSATITMMAKNGNL